jgi:hypothetical protein
MPSDTPAPLALVPVARFQEAAEAGAFSAIAAECGVGTRLMDARRSTPAFDGTLGGTLHPVGFTVYVRPEELASLRHHLESAMELDPLDPLHTADRSELLAMAEGPTNGNLCEQIIALKILAARPPEASPVAPETPETDSHLAADRNRARWLGAIGLGFTAIYLTILLNGIVLTAQPDSEYASYSFSEGLRQTVWHDHDPVAGMIRPFLLTLIPMGAGAALLLSHRPLRNGTSRPQFPLRWRIIGHLLFWLPVGVLTVFLILVKR